MLSLLQRNTYLLGYCIHSIYYIFSRFFLIDMQLFRAGHTTVVPDLLCSSRILIIHLGPTLLPLPTGLQYIIADSDDSVLPSTNVARVIDIATKLVKDQNGVLVASADILLDGKLDLDDNHQLTGDIVLPTVSSSAHYATSHGLVVSSRDGSVSNIFYQPSLDSLNGQENVDIISGMVWFSPGVAESLVKLYSLSPIDGCTYMGADSGEASLQMSLYYDILPASCSGAEWSNILRHNLSWSSLNFPDLSQSNCSDC